MAYTLKIINYVYSVAAELEMLFGIKPLKYLSYYFYGIQNTVFVNSDVSFFISSKILTPLFLIPKHFFCSIHGVGSHLVSAYYI